jgi:hypothetical protein
MQKYNLPKIPLKKPKSFKISSFKDPYIKIDLLLRGQNPLSYYTL